MAILNYITSIATETTAAEIQKKLVTAGTQAFMSEYNDDGVMCAMSFKINGLFFHLPLKIEGVYHVLQQDSKVPQRLKNYEQAARVAWRILKNWIEVQIAFIESEQAELEQLFFPYIQNQDGKTLYETIKKNGFKQITSG